MLRWFLNSKFYRTLKNGLLLDFFFKKLNYYIATYLMSNFAIFFGDKFLVDLFVSTFNRIIEYFSLEWKRLQKFSTKQLIIAFILLITWISVIISIFIFL